MNELWLALTAYPTVVLTVPLGLVLAYWLFVIAGALDHEFLDGLLGAGHDGAAEGLLEGAAEGAHEGALEHAAEAGLSLAGILSTLRLRNAPISVVGSVLILVAWFFCALGSDLLRGVALGPLLSFVASSALLFGSLVLAVPLTSLLVRPLGRIMITSQAEPRSALIGRTCLLRTGRVDQRFGQALVEGSGAAVEIQVRCDHENTLGRGDEALVVDWDPQREAFRIEPLSMSERNLLSEKT